MDSERRAVTYDPLVELMRRFEAVRNSPESSEETQKLPIEERLKRHIIDGSKKNLEADLEEALLKFSPLQVVNDVLLDGMKTVGELFGSGQMQLPFVLQSAEVMKASVRYLEPKMEKVEGSEKGSILLATVAGDVHDIGKNLVDIILTNNGYRVVNIGIKQPIEVILREAESNQCKAIGLSGLLVKSTLIMRENLLEMNERGVSHYPVILGGAALTRAYVEEDLRSLYQGNVFYAKDAFEGLDLMGRIFGGELGDVAPTEPKRVQSHRLPDQDSAFYQFDGTYSSTEPVEPPKLPFWGAKTFEKFDVLEIFRYINPIALFRGQWQFKRQTGMGNQEFDAWLKDNAQPIFERLQRELSKVVKPKVRWGYFPCRSRGNDLVVRKPDGGDVTFTFPRQTVGDRLCISDFFRSDVDDVVGFQAVTVGSDVSAYEKELFKKGDYRDYLFVHGMGVESAEALAEYWHMQMRKELGIDDQEPDSLKLLFSAKYHGSRYSFGYPACPNLEDQTKLFELLRPEEVGINLTEEFMLEPEQSTTAIVVHHPQARYFNIR